LRRHQWVGTPETVAEFYSVLFSAKFDRFVTFGRREEIAAFLSPFVSIRRVDFRIEACRDPKDDKFLEAAVAGEAHLLVTGDRDLLALDPVRSHRNFDSGRLYRARGYSLIAGSTAAVPLPRR
jgi:putative PIN family toxin of toxin-antitoxin system